jgi:hypothetical protein
MRGWAEGSHMQRSKPVLLLVLLAGATAVSVPSAAVSQRAAELHGTIITDAAGDERHIVKSIVGRGGPRS